MKIPTKYLILCCFLLFSVSTPVHAQPKTITLEDTVEIHSPDKTEINLPKINNNQFVPWFIEDIKAPALWELLSEQKCTQEIIVAVIDTGVDYKHPNLANAMWVNQAEVNGLADIDDDGNGYVDDLYGINTYHNNSNPMDDSVDALAGHGTHIAGTILQVAKVSSEENPFQVKIMAIKTGNMYGTFHQEDIVEAVNYAVANGADIINLSLGTLYPTDTFEQCMKAASEKCLIVSAAGNQETAINENNAFVTKAFYPAAYPFVLGVMAHDTNHLLAPFSNYDLIPNTSYDYEISAPGVDIYSTIQKENYALMSGTSMASAVVSGSAALLYQYAPKGTTGTEIKEMLLTYGKANIQNNTTEEIIPPYLSVDLSSFPKNAITVTPTVTPPPKAETITKEEPLQTSPTPTSAQTVANPLAAPTITSITGKNSGITLCFTKTPHAKGYEIYRKKGKKGTFKKYVTLASSQTRYCDKKVTTGIIYYYKIRCLGISVKQNSSFSTTEKMILLKKPANVKLSSKGISTYLTWSKSKSADGYYIYYQTRNKKKQLQIGKRKHSQTKRFSIPKIYLKKGGYVRIRAYKKIGNTIHYSPYVTKKIKH